MWGMNVVWAHDMAPGARGQLLQCLPWSLVPTVLCVPGYLPQRPSGCCPLSPHKSERVTDMHPYI